MKSSCFNRIILLEAPADCVLPVLNASVISKFTSHSTEMLKLGCLLYNFQYSRNKKHLLADLYYFV